MNPRTTPREHGTRARYVFGPFGSDRKNGCRCQPCKDANCAYARFEQKRVRLNRDTGTFARPMVTTSRALAHIEGLRAEGIGYRHIARLAGIATSAIGDIISGRSTRIRRETETAILAVTAQPAPAALVDAKPTWELIDRLLAAGVTKKRIGQAITGRPGTLALQLRRDRILARSAERVQELYDATFPLACSCGEAFTGIDGWRAHNEVLVTFHGHKLEVAA